MAEGCETCISIRDRLGHLQYPTTIVGPAFRWGTTHMNNIGGQNWPIRKDAVIGLNSKSQESTPIMQRRGGLASREFGSKCGGGRHKGTKSRDVR